MLNSSRFFFVALLCATMASAGTVNLAADPDFAAFPQACDSGTDVGCWAVPFGDWSAGSVGNTQVGGSDAPSAQCDDPSNSQVGEEGDSSRCTVVQCIDISAYPAGTDFTYGFAHREQTTPDEISILAIGYQNGICNGLGSMRDQTPAGAPMNSWRTTSSSFQSQPLDQTVGIAYQALSDLPNGEGQVGAVELWVDDGFLLVDVELPPPPAQGIPAVSPLGLAALAFLLALAAFGLARRRRSLR